MIEFFWFFSLSLSKKNSFSFSFFEFFEKISNLLIDESDKSEIFKSFENFDFFEVLTFCDDLKILLNVNIIFAIDFFEDFDDLIFKSIFEIFEKLVTILIVSKLEFELIFFENLKNFDFFKIFAEFEISLIVIILFFAFFEIFINFENVKDWIFAIKKNIILIFDLKLEIFEIFEKLLIAIVWDLILMITFFKDEEVFENFEGWIIELYSSLFKNLIILSIVAMIGETIFDIFNSLIKFFENIKHFSGIIDKIAIFHFDLFEFFLKILTQFTIDLFCEFFENVEKLIGFVIKKLIL